MCTVNIYAHARASIVAGLLFPRGLHRRLASDIHSDFEGRWTVKLFVMLHLTDNVCSLILPSCLAHCQALPILFNS